MFDLIQIKHDFAEDRWRKLLLALSWAGLEKHYGSYHATTRIKRMTKRPVFVAMMLVK